MNDDLLDHASAQKESAFGYQIAEWTLSIHANRLTKESGAVDLEYRQTRILVYLIERPHQIISKDELIKAIWEKKVVNEESLPVAISQIRKALNDDARTPRFIKTIPGVGYQFIADPIALALPIKESSLRKFPRSIALLLALIGLVLICFAAWKLGQQSSANNSSPKSTKVSACDEHLFGHENRTELEMRGQISGLRNCIEQEPSNAQAHLKLAEAKMWLYGESVVQPEKSEEVLALLNRSLVLDPTQAYAHLWLAYLASQGNQDDRTAEIQFKKALALAPNDAIIHMHYSHFLLVHQRFDEARKHLDSKRDINPLTYSQTDLVWLYILQGDYNKAEQELDRIAATENQDIDFHTAAENVYVRNGKYKKAFEHMRWFFQRAKFSDEKIQTLETIFSEAGMKGVFAWLYQTKEEAELGQFSPPLSFARYAIFAGKPDDAKKYLKDAYDQRNIHAQCTMADPFFNTVINQKDFKSWLLNTQMALK